LRIESDDAVPYQLDGDPGGVLPVEITILPQRVRLLVTESWAIKHGFQQDGAS
jgi:diacylglycerol kinase family enzyme